MAEWISVKDRLPKDDEVVIVMRYGDPDKEYSLAVYISDAGNWCIQPFRGVWYHSRSYVTHWMPWPEPPEQEELLIEALEALADLEAYQDEVAQQLAKRICEEATKLFVTHMEEIVATAIKEAIQ